MKTVFTVYVDIVESNVNNYYRVSISTNVIYQSGSCCTLVVFKVNRNFGCL